MILDECLFDMELKEGFEKSLEELNEDASYGLTKIKEILSSLTHNFKDKDGSVRTYYKDEKEHAKNVLRKFYKTVEVSDGRTGEDEEMSWVIAFSSPIEK